MESRRARRAAIAVGLLVAIVFLVPIGGDNEIDKRVFPDRIEHFAVYELWSLGTLVVFGIVFGESHLTKGTVAGGIAIAVLSAGLTYVVVRALTALAHHGHESRELVSRSSSLD